MRFLSNPVTYLVGSNIVFWGLPLLLVQLKAADPTTPSTLALTGPQQQETRPEAKFSEPVGKIASVGHVTEDPTADASNALRQDPLLEPANSHPSDPQIASSGSREFSEQPRRMPKTNVLSHEFADQLNGADGLGGELTLKSRREPMMPMAARAEKLHQQRTGDPLAALPLHWRDSLRKEIKDSTTVNDSKLVRLPVPHLKDRQEVPVIVNDKGVADSMVLPRDPSVRTAVETWASRQVASQPGTVQVYVVAAEPFQDNIETTR